MFLRNKRDFAVEVPDLVRDTSYWFDAGGVGEVPDDLGASLLEQVDNWEKAKAADGPYAGWKKNELVDEARNRGLDETGSVADLRERLTAHDVSSAVADEQPFAGEEG